MRWWHDGVWIVGVAGLVAVVAPADAGVFGFDDAVRGAGLGFVASLSLSPDGTSLYATTPRDAVLDGPVVTAYSRAVDGTLAQTQVVFEGPAGGGPGSLCGAGQLTVTPDGRHVYVIASCAGAVRPFLRAAAGDLTALPPVSHVEGRTDALSSPSAITVGADGADVYVANESGEIGVFRRDAMSGDLAYRSGMVIQPIALRVLSLALSPDGTSLYVAASDLGSLGGEARIVVFRRDPTTGTLAFLESKTDGDDGFVSLAGFFSVVVAPDGRNVYAGRRYDEPVLVSFDRDAAGTLRATSVDVGPDPGFSSQSLVAAGDGRLVVAAGEEHVTVFARDPANGRLTSVQTLDDGPGGAFGLCQIGYFFSTTAIAIDPTDTDLYVAGNCGTIGHLRRTCGDGALDSGEACDDGNRLDGDGCDAACRVDPCFACAGTPSACTPKDGIACDPRNACVTGTHCLAGVCGGGSAVGDGTPCDDDDACTGDDRCVGGSCRGAAPIACGACEACDRRFGCVGAIHAGCFVSPVYTLALGSIDVGFRSNGSHAAQWTWRGAEFDGSRLGDPTSTTGYEFCLIDAHGDPPFVGRRRGKVLASASVPPGPCGRACWRGAHRGTVVYRDAKGRHDGVRALSLRPGGRHGARLELVLRAHDALGHQPPLDVPVTAQLTNDAGACWAAEYRSITANTRRRFRAHAGSPPPDRVAR